MQHSLGRRSAPVLRSLLSTRLTSGLLCLLGTAAMATAQSFVFEDLGPVIGSGPRYAPQINRAGRVVCTNGGAPFYVDRGASRVGLTLPPGATLGQVRAMNNLGIMVGGVITNGVSEACLWLANGSHLVLTPFLGGDVGIEMAAINDLLTGIWAQESPAGSQSTAVSFAVYPFAITPLTGPTVTMSAYRVNNANQARANSWVGQRGPMYLAATQSTLTWTHLDTISMQADMADLNAAGVAAGSETVPNAPSNPRPVKFEAGTRVPYLIPLAWSGARFQGIGPCNAAGGYFISNVSGMAAMYHHPAWVPGVSDANSLRLIGPRPSGQLAFISDLADGNAEFPGIEPLGQVQMTGQWRPTGASVQHLFRMTQCLTDHDLDGVPGTLADVAAFMADHLANSLRADLNCDNALDAADIAAFNALMAAGLGC